MRPSSSKLVLSGWSWLLLCAACNTSLPEPVAHVSAASLEQPHAEAASCQHDHAAGASCNHGEATSVPAPTMSTLDPDHDVFKVADPSQVCMVRNHVMGRPQPFVEVAGATYFGCCAGCLNRLQQAPEARLAIDPVSQRPIDKALAVMAQNERGNVLYFESDSNLAAYQAGFH